MEKIELKVEKLDGAAIGSPWSAVFGMAGGTIGRGGQNKLVLPDADAGVARVHAMVRLGSDAAYIANLCERRSMTVGGQEVLSGQEVQLQAGAEISIGPYGLRATPPLSPPDKKDRSGSSIGLPPTPATAPAASPVVPLNVFDDVSPPAPSAAPARDRPLVIPDDFDMFAPDLARDGQSRDPWVGGLPPQSLAEVSGSRNDELLRSLPTAGRYEHALDNPAHSGLPKGLDSKIELDPMRLFEGRSPLDVESLSLSDAASARGPELAQVFNLPRRAATAKVVAAAPNAVLANEASELPVRDYAVQTVQALGLQSIRGLDLNLFGDGDGLPLAAPSSSQSVQAVATPAPLPAPTPTSTPIPTLLSSPEASAGPADVDADPSDPSALIAAFMQGAGLVPGRVDAALTPEFMRHFGEAFRVAVQGTIDLLAARSEIKREFRADVTIIAPRANNPLKFLPDADGVIMQMVGQTFPGFMKPVPSLQEAYLDLRVHQLALMAGIRAAYSEALTRFNPAELEKNSRAAGGLMTKLSSAARKAAVWDDYKQSYEAIRRNAEDDMVAFSGKAFVTAYEAAAAALREKT